VKRLGVEASSGSFITVAVRGGRITDARKVVPPPSATGGTRLGSLLGQSRFGGTPVHVVVSEAEHVHRMMLLPPMTPRERAEVVQREGSREGEGSNAAAWKLLRRIEVDGLPKDEVLLVLASSAKLQDTLNPLVSSGIIPRTVVTGPLALMAAARALSATPLTVPTALVHWSASTLTIAVVSDGILKFSRVIEPPAAALDPFEWIPVEIDRSIRHYAFLSKGERVEQVMVSVADGESARRLFAGGQLSERLRLSVTNLNALMAPALPPIAAGDLATGAFILAYGAALLAPREAPNLLPPALEVQQRSRRVIMASVAAAVLILAVLASQYVTLNRQQTDLRARVARQQAATQADRARAEEAARAEAEREQMRQFARLLTDDPLKLISPADALREIARVTPASLRLDQLRVTTDAQGYVFSLTGRVDDFDFTEAQQSLNDFYYGLRGSPLFHSVEIQQSSRLSPASGEEGAAATAGQEPEGRAGGPPPASANQEARPLGFVMVLRLRRTA
jgi:Tfp pilus assembly protein PilN